MGHPPRPRLRRRAQQRSGVMCEGMCDMRYPGLVEGRAGERHVAAPTRTHG